MATVTSLNYLFTAHEANISAKVDGFERALEQIAGRLRKGLIDLEMNSINGDPLSWQERLLQRQIVHLQVQIRGQLNNAGYPELVDKFMTAYDESALFGQQVLEAIGKSDALLQPMRPDTVKNLKQFDMTAFEEIGNNAIRELSKQLTLNALVGKKRSDVIESMNNVLDAQFTGKAELYADTALRSFDRTVNMQLWKAAGIGKYKYFGPKDNVNRPFCASHVGKTYPLAEIQKMSNGSAQFANVLVYGGGPRCRHTWTPQPEAN